MTSPACPAGPQIVAQSTMGIEPLEEGTEETWDPKPDGPLPARGEFGAIRTSVPGVLIGELLPRSAKLMHKLSVIRSMRRWCGPMPSLVARTK